MAKTLSQINIAADNFSVWVSKTNQAINAIATEVITANSDANGALTTGNAYLQGYFGADTLVASVLKGGKLQNSAPLIIGSNVNINAASLSVLNTLNIGNSSVNATINTSTFILGLNVSIANDTLSIGNSSISLTANSTRLDIGTINTTLFETVTGDIELLSTNNLTVNTGIHCGNGVTNVSINSSGFWSSNASGTFQIGADAISNTFFSQKFNFSNSVTSGNTTQTVASFDKSFYRSAEFLVSMADAAANSFMVAKVLGIHDGTNAWTTEYGDLTTNASMGVFGASVNSTHFSLNFTPFSATANIVHNVTRIGMVL